MAASLATHRRQSVLWRLAPRSDARRNRRGSRLLEPCSLDVRPTRRFTQPHALTRFLRVRADRSHARLRPRWVDLRGRRAAALQAKGSCGRAEPSRRVPPHPAARVRRHLDARALRGQRSTSTWTAQVRSVVLVELARVVTDVSYIEAPPRSPYRRLTAGGIARAS